MVTVASPVPSSNRIYVGVVAETLPALRLLRPLISLLSGVPGKDTSTCTWRSCASSSSSGFPVNTGHATEMKNTQNDSQENLLRWKPPFLLRPLFLSRRNARTFPYKKTPLIRPPRLYGHHIYTANGQFWIILYSFSSLIRPLAPRGQNLCFENDMHSHVCSRFVFRIQLRLSFRG